MLYLNSGYLNFDFILAQKQPFNFIVGGRGTGKTYGVLSKAAAGELGKIVYMRRTQAQADIISKPEFSPFRSIDDEITVKPVTKYNAGIYKGESGEPLGYIVALSTISNLRGFDMSDVDTLIYDEFIAERHERPIKQEGTAFLNCYETINRNRELQGRKPLTVICLANANNLSNPVFIELGLVSKAEKMERDKQEFSILPKRGIALFVLTESPISQAKSETAIYKLTAGSEFYRMSIDNDFRLDREGCGALPIKEFIPICTINNLTFYRHKSSALYYVADFKNGGCEMLSSSKQLLSRYPFIKELVLSANIRYQNYEVKETFLSMINVL